MLHEIFGKMSFETLCFVVVILLFNVYFHVRFTEVNTQKAPAFLTTLGILGTFVGIALGLLYFDPNNVQKSVPALIEGIKTAVWASALGIFCALSIKFREILSLRNMNETAASRGATADDIADILNAIDLSIAGEGEASLLGQMKLNRVEQAEKMEVIHQSFESFYDNITERNTKLLVDALGKIVLDFNEKISDQFGGNFKQLNQACEKMVEWQQQYTTQINEMVIQQQNSAQAMQEISKQYEAVAAHSETFSVHAKGLSAMLTGLESQRHQIESSLTALAMVLNKASDGLPRMEQQLTEMTRQLSDGMLSANQAFNTHMGEIISKTKEQVLVLDAALTEELTKSLESFGRQMASLSQKFADDYGPITDRLSTILAIGK